jgi:hypothetical protein
VGVARGVRASKNGRSVNRDTRLMLPIVTREILFVQNFIEELKRLVPTK